MERNFETEYCRVSYLEKENVVLIAWKQFCCLDDYRKPAWFASELLKRNENSNLVIDARNGFEDEEEDVEWGFQVLLPEMGKSSCKNCIFIMNEISELDDEIDLWTVEFKKYFQVYKVKTFEEAIRLLK